MIKLVGLGILVCLSALTASAQAQVKLDTSIIRQGVWQPYVFQPREDPIQLRMRAEQLRQQMLQNRQMELELQRQAEQRNREEQQRNSEAAKRSSEAERRRLESTRASSQDDQRNTQLHPSVESWLRAAAPRMGLYDDFEATVFAPDLPMTHDMLRLMSEKTYAADIAYYLGKRKMEALAISKLDILEARKVIDNIEERIIASGVR